MRKAGSSYSALSGLPFRCQTVTQGSALGCHIAAFQAFEMRQSGLLRFHHRPPSVVAAVRADHMRRLRRATLWACLQLLGLERVVRSTHTGTGIGLFTFWNGHRSTCAIAGVYDFWRIHQRKARSQAPSRPLAVAIPSEDSAKMSQKYADLRILRTN
jgi:hypothetical protein